MARVVGVDVGGSGVRAAVVAGGEVKGEVIRRALLDRGVDTVVAAVAEAVAELGGADAVGVGIPGWIQDGVVLASPNFPEWRDLDARGRLTATIGVPVVVENDANAAAMGAWAVRGGRGDLVLLTLGTGVGGGIVIDGRLVRGAGGVGAELGHTYAGGERPCNCGALGCLETLCSTVGLLRSAIEQGVKVATGEEVVVAARAGEPWATRAVEEAATALGRSLVSLVNIFNPDVLAIAGGLSQAHDLLAPIAEGYLRTHGIPPAVERAKVVWCGAADEYAILGAGTLAASLR